MESWDKIVAPDSVREAWGFPDPLANTYMSGVHREPKPGALPAPGNVRQPQAYIFVGGKRVSTARTQRFAAK